jgi:voltage-gated potassium channel
VEDSIPVARKHLLDAIPPNRWKAIALSALRVAIGLGFMWWTYSLVPKDVDQRMFIPAVLLLVGLAVYIWFVKREVERVLGSRYPEVLAVEGLILSAALFMVIFATIYLVIDGLNPGSFTEPLSHLSSHYLTLTILSTVGFGDITAVTDQARLAVMIQMAMTLGFLAVTIRVFAWATKRALAERHRSDASTEHS